MAKVLVVDDEPHIRTVIELKLRSAGYDVYTAADSEIANEEAREILPDLLITDYRMPGARTGTELILSIRTDPRLEQLPAILLTGSVAIMQRIEQELSDADRVVMLPKPFSPRKLAAVVAELLG